MWLYDFLRRHKNGRNGSAVQHIPTNTTSQRQRYLDTGSIRMLEEKLASKQDGTWLSGSRTAQESFSRAVIEAAKECGLYISKQECQNLGVRKMVPSGESIIYENQSQGVVYKIRNPFAKQHLKSNNLNNVLYEHIVHNILFPNIQYSFVGISEANEELRIVLSQQFIFESNIPTQQEIEEHLKSLDLLPEDNYYYGNQHVAVTDVFATSDNVISSSDGTLFFIDPIIKIKSNIEDIIAYYCQ